LSRNTAKIGIIGHLNHAARMLRLLARHTSVQSLRVFHPDASKLVGLQWKDLAVDVEPTSDLRDPFSLDGVVIASPSNTHAA